MLDVSESKLVHYAVHAVGQAHTISEELFEQPEPLLEAAFTQLAFYKTDFEQPYVFFHETNMLLHELATYTKAIFADTKAFLPESQHIATHLQAVSSHPNIKDGELFVGLFENCLFQEQLTKVLAIVKIEDKETFLNVAENLSMTGIDGINTKRIHHTALIVYIGADIPPVVYMKTKRKEDAVYWQEQFLKIKVADERFYKTNQALDECKKYILKDEQFTNTEKLELLNKTLDYFRTEEQFEADNYIETVLERVAPVEKDILQQTVQPFETEISESAIDKAEKTYKRKIRLDSNIEIQVHVKNLENVHDVIEIGYDEETQRKFYKIYFDEEL